MMLPLWGSSAGGGEGVAAQNSEAWGFNPLPIGAARRWTSP